MFGRKTSVPRPERRTPPPSRRRHRAASLQVGAGRPLAGGYEDQDIEGMAQEDGKAELYTSTFGDGNRQPRAILANIRAANVGSGILGYQLREELTEIDASLERDKQKGAVLDAEAQAAAVVRNNAASNHADLDQRCHEEGLGRPDTSRKPLLLETMGLTVLGGGDVIFISVAYQVLGLSDRSILGPVTELQLAATTSVAALLISTRIAGHRLRRFTHFMGNLLRNRGATVDDGLRRQHVAGAIDSGTETFVALAGVTVILLGVSGIREAFLEGKGIPAHGSSFLAVQGGIAVAGVLLAAWFAHPYDRQWRSTSSALREAHEHFEEVVDEITNLVGDYNARVGTRRHLVAKYLEWEFAGREDASRQIELYGRRVLLSQPEPTTDNLLADDLPQPAGAPWANDQRESLSVDARASLAGDFKRLELGDVAALVRPGNSGSPAASEDPGDDEQDDASPGDEGQDGKGQPVRETTTAWNGRGPR